MTSARNRYIPLAMAVLAAAGLAACSSSPSSPSAKGGNSAGLRPKVVADDGGISVFNPFRDHRVPWTVVKDVDTADWVLVRAGGKTIYSELGA
jgi:hypothetical protein